MSNEELMELYGNRSEINALVGRRIDVLLPHGFLKVVDYMGDDRAIVEAARVSYDQEPKDSESDIKLLHFLIRNKHTSPFEMCELKVMVVAPIFVARQWVRHRTASWNEISGRYSALPGDFYVPESICHQSEKNKQASGESLDASNVADVAELVEGFNMTADWLYKRLVDRGVARETARIIMPLSQYTRWYWKIDLHNLLHFITLRSDESAQYEIRQYANVLRDIVKAWVPVTWHWHEKYN